MRTRLFVALALAFVIPAVAHAQSETKPAAPAAAAIDPVGNYTISAVVQGQAADFEMIVQKKDDGSFGGTLSNPDFGTSIISSLKVEGRTMKLVLATPQGVEALAELTLAEDNSIDGSWSMQCDGGKMTGKKNPA